MDNRAYVILNIIKDQLHPISGQHIQEILEEKHGIKLNIKTVYEVIKRINEFYFPTLKTKYIGVQKKKGFYIAYNFFEDGQIQYLLDTVRSNPNLSVQESENLESRITALSSKSQLDRLFNHETPSKHSISLMLNLTTLINAIKNQQNVYFEYTDYKVVDGKFQEVSSKNGNISQGKTSYYAISPYEIVLDGKYYYLIGYFSKRKDQLSTYRIDRMKLIRHHKSPFLEIREQYDMKREYKQSVNMFMTNSKIDLKIRFSKQVMREVVNQFGREHTVSIDNNGYYTMEIKDISNSNGLIGWLFMLQEQIEVISPIMLREQIAKRIKTMYDYYKNTL